MKRIIWSNANLDIEDWREGYAEFLEMNGIEKEITDEDIYEFMCETNSMYLDDERMNLDIETEGDILVIADIGRWDGRCSGAKFLDGNVKEIFNINSRGFDTAEFYGDGYNIRATEWHHDGVNFFEFRVVRSGIDPSKLYQALRNGEKVSRNKINYYTKSLYPYVAKIYGW